MLGVASKVFNELSISLKGVKYLEKAFKDDHLMNFANQDISLLSEISAIFAHSKNKRENKLCVKMVSDKKLLQIFISRISLNSENQKTVFNSKNLEVISALNKNLQYRELGIHRLTHIVSSFPSSFKNGVEYSENPELLNAIFNFFERKANSDGLSSGIGLPLTKILSEMNPRSAEKVIKRVSNFSPCSTLIAEFDYRSRPRYPEENILAFMKFVNRLRVSIRKQLVHDALELCSPTENAEKTLRMAL